MIVKKFFANTSREALHLVRQDLGPDALILSNRAVDNGMEILAVAQGELPTQEGVDAAASTDFRTRIKTLDQPRVLNATQN